MREYVFLKTNKEKFSDLNIELQNFLINTNNIHLYQIHNKPFLFDNSDVIHNNIYYYSFNEETDSFCLQHGYIPHFCISGSDIFSSQRMNDLSELKNIDSSIEIFWFPEDKNINFDISYFMDIITQLKLINSPICISFSSIFSNAISPLKYQFLEKINKAFNNPLLTKELSLLENEIFSTQNYFIDDTQSNYVIQNIILGIFGDEVVSNSEVDNITKISHQFLQSRKECLKCSNFQYCSNRGIGFIIKKNNLDNCLGISLLMNS